METIIAKFKEHLRKSSVPSLSALFAIIDHYLHLEILSSVSLLTLSWFSSPLQNLLPLSRWELRRQLCCEELEESPLRGGNGQ